MNIKISADSTCDLSPELVERYRIGIAPLYIVRDGESLVDGVDITPDEIYDHVAKGGSMCSTAAVSVYDYEEFFRKELESADAVVHFYISGDMSACYQNACIAAAEVGNVYPVDARNLSTGIGLLVMEAAVMAQDGKSAKEIVAHVTSLIPLVRASFVVDTLTFLHRGGRCSGAAALMGSMLKLHPKIVVRDGQMLVDKKYRGSLARCIPAYTHDLHDDLLRARPERVFITHSGCDPEVVEQVRTYLTSLNYFDAVIETRAGGVISCHCGPGTLGVLFILKE